MDASAYMECMAPDAPAVFGGYWYSTPLHAECTPGELSALSTGGACSWSRQPSQRFVRGPSLLAHGLRLDALAGMDADAQQQHLAHNARVIREAFSAAAPWHVQRCCGC